MQPDAAGRRALLLFALASLLAVGAGAATLAAAGLPPGSWLRNPIAWGVGALLGGCLFAGGRSPGVQTAALLLAPIGLAATFLAAPVEGVHRWIDVGPLHVNVAALLLPAAIVAGGLRGITSRLALMATPAVAILLLFQPDASQATAVATAAGAPPRPLPRVGCGSCLPRRRLRRRSGARLDAAGSVAAGARGGGDIRPRT